MNQVIELTHIVQTLVDELVCAGIPREQIILTYAGEQVPETAQK